MFGLEPIFEEGLRELLDAANKLKDAEPEATLFVAWRACQRPPVLFPLLSNRQSGDRLPLWADRPLN